ncbi:MAG: cell division protein FtsZ, partial [Winogradskyella sp.]|nr:cell division protein FtsZ [Winogradskyella sp.]
TKAEVVKHTLIDDETDKEDTDELIPTTQLIKDIKVVYEEVIDTNIEDEEFVITEVKQEVSDEDIIDEEEQQITLTFDLPIADTSKTEDAGEEKMLFQLDDDVKDLNVNDAVELISVTESSETGEKRYALDEFATFESSMNTKTKENEVKEEVVFERKVVPATTETSESNGAIDPMNSPISEILKERADERRRKMKDFNYKFNNAKIDEIEKIPAYKRQGVDLEQSQHSAENNASRLSVGTDDNDEIQLRSNNSFLHDNVD